MTEPTDADPYQAPEAVLDDGSGEEGLVRAAIGSSNTLFYLQYFRASASSPWKLSWNWPAFFVTSPWLLYRRMWLAWVLYTFAFPIVLYVALLVLGIPLAMLGVEQATLLGGSYLVMLLGFFLVAPAIANAFYRRKVDSLVSRAQRAAPDRAGQIEWLGKHGGTSLVWLVVLLLGLLVIGVLTAVAIPAYYDYLENAEAARQAMDAMQAPEG